MHKKLGKDGLDVITVTVDDPGDAKVRENNVATLNKTGASAFRNVYLDTKVKGFDWTKKLNVSGVPCLYVFNRDGHYVQKQPFRDPEGDDQEMDYEAADKVVEGLMKRK